MKKRTVYPVIALLLFLPTLFGHAAEKGNITSKDEVIYASLSANGDLEQIYVVNTLDVAKAGEILDYGPYTSVKNLTDVSEVLLEDEAVRLQAPEGKFYYQGNMKENTPLPWAIRVSYFLNGEEMAPDELAGKKGHVGIRIQTSANDEVDPVFFENYILQLSLTLPNRYENISAEGGMIALAGKNKQITFTVLPGDNEDFLVEAEVDDFEFQGLEIAAVPSSLPFDQGELDGITDDMSLLSEAIGDLNRGVAQLSTGVGQFAIGAKDLQGGSRLFQNGMEELNGAAPEIVNGSKAIRDGLQLLHQSFGKNGSEQDEEVLTQLPTNLRDLSSALAKIADELSALGTAFSPANRGLGQVIKAIPTLSQEELSIIEERLADPQLFSRVRALQERGQAAKASYSQAEKVFEQVEPALNEASTALRSLSRELTNSADAFSRMDNNNVLALQTEIGALASNYQQFHQGLMDYTEGVKDLGDSYEQIHGGIEELTGHTGEIAAGIEELHGGTKELARETKNLPKQMEEEIHKAFEEYDKSDFTPVSFVSAKNQKVYSVQFVMRTASIEQEEPAQATEQQTEPKGIWQRLLDLF